MHGDAMTTTKTKTKVSSGEVDQFAKTLAGKLSKKYPADFEKDPQKKVSEKRLTRIIEDTMRDAITFRETHDLGWYKRARLGNSFNWELRNLGYSKQFVETVTEALVVYISRKGPAADAKQE